VNGAGFDVQRGSLADFAKTRRVVVPEHIRAPQQQKLRELRQHKTRPCPVAIHEAAHELVAKEYRCRDVMAFVRNREHGVCSRTHLA
jgi:hypothetical protein